MKKLLFSIAGLMLLMAAACTKQEPVAEQEIDTLNCNI
jgi:hypothetical protein